MAAVNKKPIKKGVAKVPVVMQLETLECGAACLCMILAYFGKWMPIEKVREDCGVSRNGSNARSILIAARNYGLKANAFFYETKNLKEHVKFPCIVHWNLNHFVVLNGFKGDKAYINDPARGSYHVTIETFDECFTGICLQFEPTEAFVSSGKPKSMLSFAVKRLRGNTAALVFTMLTSVIATMLAFIHPAFSRLFLDHLLSNSDIGWMKPFLLIFGLFIFVEILMSALQEVYSIRINGKISVTGNASFMWKVLKMPIKFFSQRMAGDIQQRQLSNADIANTLINITSPLVINTVLLAFYIEVMFRYSVILALIGIASVAINVLISSVISKKLLNIVRVSMRDIAKLASFTVAGIEMIETIKSSGSENGFFKKWSGIQANVNTQQVKYLKLNQFFGMVSQFVSDITNYIILFLGLFLTMQGQFTVGMVMAFQGFLLALWTPVQTMISSGQILQEMRTKMERVDDVMEYPDDDVFDENGFPENVYKITGDIELKNISFGYSPLDKPFIKNFNLKIRQGMSIALVGASGSGKSTISKLISGLYKPWTGTVCFDGRPLNEISKSLFCNSVTVVDQDIFLFEDTIANNIKMWDNSIEDFEMILAARDAQIHDDIMMRTKGYQHVLVEEGRDFSGGQCQRIEIARALARDPSIIILDEATSMLDARTEYEISKAISARGITCIIIAHRLSTIRSCDEIIVMDQGEIVSTGTHKELMENCEIYQNLVSAE